MAKRKLRAAGRSAPRKGSKRKPPRRRQPEAPADERSAAPAKPGFVVVGVGASAGGLEAFKAFFNGLPSARGLAFVLIQHLDPTHESLTAELLSRHTPMRVVQATDEMQVEPDHVYVIPPNKYLTIGGGTLHLSEPIQRRGIRVPIDFFFRSLADDQHERAIAVILSGTGSDGTLGVREIKAAGGMVMVQSPDSTIYDGMPRSAIAAGVVDYVLPVDQMPDALLRYVRHWYVHGSAGEPTHDEAAMPFAGQRPAGLEDASAGLEDASAGPAAAPVSEDLATIIGLLRARVNYDVRHYKKGTLTRRIQRRMGLKHVQEMSEYVDLLGRDDGEVTALYKDLLIGVTNFFREPEAWRVLEKEVIEPLVADIGAGQRGTEGSAAARSLARRVGGDNDAIRVWIPGCATGEEAYSLAMLLSEKLQQANKHCDVNIFASDIDSDALAFARAGVYPENIAHDVSLERLRQFFTKADHTWRINKDIREAVVFAEQNVISDPPFSKLDLVSCRNLLIYLEPEIQKKILAMFHFALRDGGYLFLGNAETISQQHDLFEPVARKWRIYRRLDGSRRHLVMPAASSGRSRPTADSRPRPAQHDIYRLPAAAQQVVLQRFAPACALVNRQFEVLYLHGPVDGYLQLPSGEQTHDLLAMVRQGLRTKLRTAVQQAIQNEKPILLDEVRVRRGHEYFPVRVSIEPLGQPSQLAGLLLLAFDEATAEQRVRVIYVEPADSLPADKPVSSAEYQAVLRQLESELNATREDLHTTIEEWETSNEEFKAANEEVTSINEELQSTNEELETSKEELQSLNEELQTVNSQLESKIGELNSTNDDLHNLLTSIDHATLFLDRQLRIKRFTPAATNLLRIIGTDVGRPFADFVRNFTDDELLSDAETVLQRLTPIENEIEDQEGRWYMRRIVPYRTEDDRIEGVVITFTNTTIRKQQEESLKKLTGELEETVRKRTELLQVVHDITAAANQARTVDEALTYAIERICEYNSWHAGRLFRWDSAHDSFVSTDICYTAEDGDSARRKQFVRQTPDISARGLIPEVARTGKPRWIENLDAAGQVDARIGELGVRSAIAFPVLVDQHVEAVLEFYSQHDLVRDERFIAAMQNVGIQLAHVLLRKESERQMAELGLVERQRLGRELHDSVGQQISALGLLTAALKDDLAREPSAGSGELLDKLESHVERSQHQIRSLMVGLLPVDVQSGGLSAALQRLASETARVHRVACRFELADDVELTDNFTATQLFLIAGEATHNAVKHARASEIVIRLADRAGIRVTVTDDGIGLPPDVGQSRGLGLRIMRHRASLIEAELDVDSPPSGGTTVTCHLQREATATS